MSRTDALTDTEAPYTTRPVPKPLAPLLVTDLDMATIAGRLRAAREAMREVTVILAPLLAAEDTAPVELHELHGALTNLEDAARRAEGFAYSRPARAQTFVTAAVEHHKTVCDLLTRLAPRVRNAETRAALLDLAAWEGE